MYTKEYLKTLTTKRLLQDVESLIYTYPKHFPTIEEAKTYIGNICATKNFTYGDPPANALEYVKDRMHFLIAVKAHEKGEFYLDEGLKDPKVLRDAIERDIARLMPLIRFWPREFADVNAAKNYVESMCYRTGFQCMPFAGVQPEKLRDYVAFNTARRAFEMGNFGLMEGAGGWRVKTDSEQMRTPGQEFESLKDAIASDISRLYPLIRVWSPSFIDLNAARNFVGEFCYDLRFRYSGYGEVEMHKYRMFVNFHTAKRAFEEGRFELNTQAEGKRKLITAEKRAKKMGVAEVKLEMKGSMIELLEGLKTSCGMSPVEQTDISVKKTLLDSVAVPVTDTELKITALPTQSTFPKAITPFDRRQDSFANVYQQVEELALQPADTDGKISTPSSSTAHDSMLDEDEDEEVEGLGLLPTMQEDPFKELVAELRREFMLKAAFE